MVEIGVCEQDDEVRDVRSNTVCPCSGVAETKLGLSALLEEPKAGL